MATNTDAIEKALRGALREVKDVTPRTGTKIVTAFRLALSMPSPPRSRPGEPPHAETGAYRDSITHKAQGTTITVRSRTNMGNSIATWTEFGTQRNGRPYMRPRPHWRTILPSIVKKILPPVIYAAIVEGETK